MDEQNKKEVAWQIKAAYITGIFVLLAACITGLFGFLNTLISNEVTIVGMNNPNNSQPTIAIATNQPNTSQNALPTESFSNCDGINWETCWEIDDNAKTLIWVGLTNGVSDIGQKGIALEKIKLGYTAIVTLEIDMTINVCSGTIDGVKHTGSCPKILPISTGTHNIISPGESGGFVIYP